MSNNSYHYSSNHLYYNGSLLLKTEAPIESMLDINGAIVLLLDASVLKSDSNVFCYDSKGNLKWKIPQPDKLHDRNYYTSIYLFNNTILQAYSKNGVEVTIDKETGVIISKELIK